MVDRGYRYCAVHNLHHCHQSGWVLLIDAGGAPAQAFCPGAVAPSGSLLRACPGSGPWGRRGSGCGAHQARLLRPACPARYRRLPTRFFWTARYSPASLVELAFTMAGRTQTALFSNRQKCPSLRCKSVTQDRTASSHGPNRTPFLRETNRIQILRGATLLPEPRLTTIGGCKNRSSKPNYPA